MGFLDIQPFDASLGTLKKVTVEFTGETIAGIVVPLSVGPYGTPASINVVAEIRHDFDRVADQYFDFGGPATTHLQQLAPTLGQTVTFVTPFRYTFSFDATTDIMGGNTVPDVEYGASPPFWAQALLADFLPKGPGDLNQTLFGQELVSFTGGTDPVLLTTGGELFVAYHYDRADSPTDPPPPIPEPTTLALALGGLAAVVAWRRRRRRRIGGEPSW